MGTKATHYERLCVVSRRTETFAVQRVKSVMRCRSHLPNGGTRHSFVRFDTAFICTCEDANQSIMGVYTFSPFEFLLAIRPIPKCASKHFLSVSLEALYVSQPRSVPIYPLWFAAPNQAGRFARDAVYRAREERAASKHWGNVARAKAERAKRALEKGTAVADDLCKQAEAVGSVLVSLRPHPECRRRRCRCRLTLWFIW